MHEGSECEQNAPISIIAEKHSENGQSENAQLNDEIQNNSLGNGDE